MAVMVQIDIKSLITVQVNFCCLIPDSLGISKKIHLIVIIKIFAIDLYHYRRFLAAPFDFTTFFTLAILNRARPFLLQPGCF